MKETQGAIAVINEMQAAGVIGKYAIGGAVAATFYIEPTSTYDIDVFIPLKTSPEACSHHPAKFTIICCPVATRLKVHTF